MENNYWLKSWENMYFWTSGMGWIKHPSQINTCNGQIYYCHVAIVRSLSYKYNLNSLIKYELFKYFIQYIFIFCVKYELLNMSSCTVHIHILCVCPFSVFKSELFQDSSSKHVFDIGRYAYTPGLKYYETSKPEVPHMIHVNPYTAIAIHFQHILFYCAGFYQ